MSGTTGGGNYNINVNFTANTGPLNAGATQAQAAINNVVNTVNQATAATNNNAAANNAATAALRNYGNAAQAAAAANQQAAAAATNAAQGMGQVNQAAGAAGAAMNAAGGNMQQFGIHTSRARYEMMVLAHEAMTGRFSRIPGSLMVLAEQMGGVSAAAFAMAGAFAVATMAAVHLVEWLGRIQAAKGQAEAAGAFFNPALNQTALDKMVEQTRKLHDVTTEDAGEMVSTYARMRGANEATIQALIDQTVKYAAATGEKLPAAAKKLASAFEAPSTEGHKFLEEINAGAEAIKKFDDVTGNDQAVQRRAIMLQALDQKTAAVAKTTVQHTRQMMEDVSNSSAGWGNPLLTGGPDVLDQMDQMDRLENERAAKLKANRDKAMSSFSNEEKLPAGQQVTWFEKQQEGADELRAKVVGAATNYKTANQQANTQLAEYWKGVEAQAVQGSKDQLRAHEEFLRHKEMADMANLRLGTAGAKSAEQTEIASLSAQQEANKDNAQMVMQLEEQKLAAIKRYYGENSAQYQNELKRKYELERYYSQQSTRMAENDLKTKEKLDSDALAAKTARLNAEVAENKVTKEEAIDELKRQVLENERLELEMLDNLEKNLKEGTEAFRKAENERAAIKSKTAKLIEQLDSQSAISAQKIAEHEMTMFTDAFSNIYRSASTSIAGLINRTESFGQAASRVATGLISDFANAGLHMLGRWIATELAMTATTQTQNAVRHAQEMGGTGLDTLIGKMLSSWLGLETSKTAISMGQSAARTAAQTAADTTVVAAQTAAKTEGAAMTAASAFQQINAAAGIAAANAFAATAAIPYIGPELAPAAAAAALASVEAFQGMAALDVGAIDVPRDMPAYIHKGEMVVPRDFASGIRSGSLTLGGGGDGGQNLSYAPVIHGGSGAADWKSEMSSLLRSSSRDMVTLLQSYTRNGSTVLPWRSRIS